MSELTLWWICCQGFKSSTRSTRRKVLPPELRSRSLSPRGKTMECVVLLKINYGGKIRA